MLKGLVLLFVVAIAGACTEQGPPPQTAVVTPPATAAADIERARNAYLVEVAKRIRYFGFRSNAVPKERITVAEMTVGRDGRVLDTRIVQSSGVVEIDHNLLAAIRQGSPYPPLPPAIEGPSASFTLPVASRPD